MPVDVHPGWTGSFGCPSGADRNDPESAIPFRRLIIVSRTTRTGVCFPSTFGLPDVDGPQPAGSYRVDHDEESIESFSRLAWRRVASFIYLSGIGQLGRRIRWRRSIPRTSMPRSKRTRSIMIDSTILQRNARPVRYETATHLFTTGQTVRLKGGFGLQSQSADTYRITGTLPPRGNSQQYRIRNDGEHYERVATQDSLEPVSISPAGPSGALIEGTFGAGQVIENQQSPDQKSRSRRRPGPSLKAQEIG